MALLPVSARVDMGTVIARFKFPIAEIAGVWVPPVLRLIPVTNAIPDAVDPGRFDFTTAIFIDGQRIKKPVHALAGNVNGLSLGFPRWF